MKKAHVFAELAEACEKDAFEMVKEQEKKVVVVMRSEIGPSNPYQKFVGLLFEFTTRVVPRASLEAYCLPTK